MPGLKGVTNSIKNTSKKIADTGKKLARRYKPSNRKPSALQTNIPAGQIIRVIIQIPSVRIDRNEFLSEQFKTEEESLVKAILEKGPTEAGCDREKLKKTATALVQKRITQAFVGDVPGDVLRSTAFSYEALTFYGAAIQLIQEIAYLYGENDFWNAGEYDADKTVGRLNLYYSVMNGSGKAAKALKLLSSSVTSRSFNKLTENFLEKTVYKPVFKPAAKALGVKMPKAVFGKFLSKAMPIVENAVSDGIALASLLPMAGRLIKTLDEAQFSYSASDFEADWYEISKDDEASEKQALTEINPNAEA